MIRNFIATYKKAIITILLSLTINYIVSIITFLFIYNFQIFNKSSYFATYVPSIVAMIAVLIYLYLRVGTACLIFNINIYTIVGSIGGIIVAWLFLILVDQYFSRNILFIIYYEFKYFLNTPYYIMAILLTGLIAPTIEEIIMRGYLFQSIRNHLGTYLAWIISVSLSLIIHLIGGTPLSAMLIIYFLGGIIIITAAYQVGNIPASIVVHGFLNVYTFVFNHSSS